MKTIVQIIFALAGVYLAKIFLFDDIEKMAWEMFWDGDFTIRNSNNVKDILGSATFAKSFVGFLGGSFVGILVTRLFMSKKKEKKMKKLFKILLILGLVVSFASFANADEMEFNVGDNLILVYKDYKTGVEFTTVITLVNEKNHKIFFTGNVYGKTIRDSFSIHGLMTAFFVKDNGELFLDITGLTLDNKKMIVGRFLALQKDGDNFITKYGTKAAYAEIRPIKKYRGVY